MSTSADPLLLDTSAAIALVQPSHAKHRPMRTFVAHRGLGLSGHAEMETYSVLTRLPAPQRLTSHAAVRLIRTNFPHTRRLPVSGLSGLLEELAELNLAGGSTYDALVGSAARHHGLTLITSDARAAGTYRAMGLDFTVI